MATEQNSLFSSAIDDKFNTGNKDLNRLSEPLLDANNEATIQGRVDDATERAGTLNEVAQGVLGRQQRALGLNISARQRNAQNKRLAIGNSVNIAAAATRERDSAQEEAKVSNLAAAGLQQGLENLSLQGLATASSLENTRNIQKQQDKANATSGLFSAAGAIAGAGIGFAIGGPAGAAVGAGVL